MIRKTLIESLGVYLPPGEVLTKDLVRGCRRPLRFPLERMSGIVSRRVAGEGEFSFDLAAHAVSRCLATSRVSPGEVELVVFTSVGRCDGPGLWISHEPSSAVRLCAEFGFSRAIAFDIASACTGMFTGIHVVDAFLASGAIRCGLVVSGEYISHLATTAQREIDGILDPRLACLTLGDAGAAVMLTSVEDAAAGFDAMGLTTIGSCAEYCMAGPTEQPHGGGIMVTNALKLTDAATRFGSAHALETMQQAGWSARDFNHVIMHQTSRTGLNGAVREINRLMRATVCRPDNTVDNLAHRGNTASTTHFVALADRIQSGQVRNGDRIIFAISGSGLTVGTALYVLDDLPERMRGHGNGASTRPEPVPSVSAPPDRTPTIRIRSTGVAPRGKRPGADSLELLSTAVQDCLGSVGTTPRDVDLLVYSGTYRSEFTSEPAIAALVAGRMDFNAAGTGARRTLAFDVMNGAMGFLDACHVSAEMIRTGKARTAIVMAGDVENNLAHFPDDLVGVEETGSAVLLEAASGDDGEGFVRFHFRTFPEHVASFESWCTNRDGKACLQFRRDPDLPQRYLEAIAATVSEMLEDEGLSLSGIRRIFPPQVSTGFIASLATMLGVDLARMVDVTGSAGDLYTSSLPCALRQAVANGTVSKGDMGLLIGVGSGIQAGCALYRF
jgi:3-oxoacyl-[acyl-carrier-protein] synthase III